jgi:hypothetical protein
MQTLSIETLRAFKACHTARDRKAFAAKQGVPVNRLWTLWLIAGRPEPQR